MDHVSALSTCPQTPFYHSRVLPACPAFALACSVFLEGSFRLLQATRPARRQGWELLGVCFSTVALSQWLMGVGGFKPILFSEVSLPLSFLRWPFQTYIPELLAGSGWDRLGRDLAWDHSQLSFLPFWVLYPLLPHQILISGSAYGESNYNRYASFLQFWLFLLSNFLPLLWLPATSNLMTCFPGRSSHREWMSWTTNTLIRACSRFTPYSRRTC